MSLNIKLKTGSDYPVLSGYMQCRCRMSTIRGPRASGKTFGSAQRILDHMAEQTPNDRGIRHTRGMVSRDSYTELMSTTVKDFMAVFEGLGDFRMNSAGPPSWRTKPGLYLSDGSLLDAEVIFQSAGVDDAAERVKGYQLSWAWFNELSGIDRAVLSNTRAGLGRYPSPAAGGVPCSWHGILSDTNSFDETHWLFPIATEPREQHECPSAGWHWFHQPGGVIDSGQVDALGRKIWVPNLDAENLDWLVGREKYYLELCQDEKDDHIKVLLGNEYGFYVDGKPVHPSYVDSVHCAPFEIKPDSRYPLVLGFDFGRTPACAITQYWESFGRWVVIDEKCSTDMTVEDFGPKVKEYLDHAYAGYQIRAYGDPAGESGGQQVNASCLDILKAKGIPIQPAPSNDVTLRRAAISGPIRRNCMDGRPAFLVSPKAKTIRKGLMGGFCYRRMRITGTTSYTEKPEKNEYSHPVEALEYALLGGGEMQAARSLPEHMRRPWPEQREYDPLNHL